MDLLEPLAEALGLTVSELLSGRELTPEELPKAAGEQIMESMRKNRRRIWQGVLAALMAVALAAGVYVGYHYATSVLGRSVTEADREGLRRQAITYLSSRQEQSHSEFVYNELTVVDLEQKGDYLAALCVDGNGHWEICIYERDSVFPDRWRAYDGTFGTEVGQIFDIDFRDQQGNAIIIMAGWGLPRDIDGYSFKIDDITYTCSNVFAGMFLDLFILPDSGDVAFTELELLDENGVPLPYENPREPGRE